MEFKDEVCLGSWLNGKCGFSRIRNRIFADFSMRSLVFFRVGCRISCEECAFWIGVILLSCFLFCFYES